ncbi:MAG: hemerythrin domain-containing protein [Gemmatimonadaceae bacterium]|nr:hemerythrin domain-containing protein [Gemmatimonadaceae bacterium]
MGEFARASDELMQEHRLIERVLDALETAAGQLEGGHPVPPEFFLDAADFIAGFADGCHHRKEEGVLFGAMVESGLPRPEEPPLEIFLDEHVEARALTRAMREAARQLQGGEAGARGSLVSSVNRYVALLRDHIVREDEMLFPMADEMLSAEQQRSVLRDFERVEREDVGAGAHQRFHALAEKLEREAAAMTS